MGAQHRIAAAVVLVAASILIGCGDEEDGSGSDAASPKAEFVAQANVACKKERAGLKAEADRFLRLQKRKPPVTRYTDLAHLVLLPTVEDEMEAIRAIGIPPGEESRINELLFGEQLVIDTLANTDRIPSIEAVELEFAESGRMLEAYGLAACANGPGDAGGV